jgi:hypothetical protein
MIENEYCTVLVTALYEGGAEQGESNVVREEEDGLSTQHSSEVARALAAVATRENGNVPPLSQTTCLTGRSQVWGPNASRKGQSKRARGGATVSNAACTT